MNSPQPIYIGDRRIAQDAPPFIVAELSGSHGGSLDTALALVTAAGEAGVEAVKLQTYTADTMTLDDAGQGFVVADPGSPWNGERLYDLYRRASTPWEWHAAIFARCREHGLQAFSTPFDATSVDFLETLGVPCYKISSFECTDLPLIRRVAATGKPVILSTGMTSAEEIGEALDAARAAGCRGIVLLKCTSTYPALPDDIHLRTIPLLRETFGCLTGLSDHSLGIGVAIAAVAFGATIIEKRLTLSRAGGTVDAAFSMEPGELAQLATETRRAWSALGEPRIGPSAAERASLACRRSLYIARDLPSGSVLTHDDVRAIRPGFGLSSKHLEEVVGRRLSRAATRGTPLDWTLLDPR